MMNAGTLTREVFPDAVRALANGNDYVPPGSAGIDAVRSTVREIILSKKEFVESDGMHAISGIMGLSMGRLKGKAAGSLISKVVREELEAFLNEKKRA